MEKATNPVIQYCAFKKNRVYSCYPHQAHYMIYVCLAYKMAFFCISVSIDKVTSNKKAQGTTVL